MADSDGTLDLLVRSENRARFLCALADDGPLDRYALEDRLDVSRRTVSRVAETLSEAGYVHERADGYALTAYGRLSTRAYRAYRDEAALLDRFRPLLREADAGTFDLDPALLRGADLTLARETSPYAILDRILELRRQATRIREVAPGVEDRSVTQLADRIRDGTDLDVEAVLPPGALDAARSHPEYGEAHRVARESAAVDFFVYPEPFSVFVGVFDDTVALAAGDGGHPSALLVSDRPELRAWAEDRIDAFEATATPLTDG